MFLRVNFSFGRCITRFLQIGSTDAGVESISIRNARNAANDGLGSGSDRLVLGASPVL